MDTNYYKQYEPIFGVWHITRLIGEGSFGKVFELQREDFGHVYKAALKAVTIPASQSEVRSVRSEGMDEESVRSYFGSMVKDLVKEFDLMSKLKGNSNVVSYENHQVIEHKDGIGWDILIQMELLTPLDEYIQQKKSLPRQEIIKLGIDLCKGLELCQKHNIVHRDIKPENTFISENGDFKLGDFGEARTLEKTTSGLSQKGTYDYMAPEVYHDKPYGTTVDIYSLGLILYRLLNGNRLPFLPPAPAPIAYSDRESARAKRFNGAPLPPPGYAEGRLGEIVLKACAFDPKDRYSSPGLMRQELEAILYSKEEGKYIYPDGDEVPQDSIRSVKQDGEVPIRQEGGTISDFGGDIHTDEGTVSDFGDSDRKGEGTISDFGDSDRKGEGTVSDFGDSGQKEEGTVSDFGQDIRKEEGTVSDFEPKKTRGGKKQAGGQPKETSGQQDLRRIAARMLPACAVVPVGPFVTTAAAADDFTANEKKYINFALKKVPLAGRGEVLGYCGIIQQPNGSYGVILTTTGICFPKPGLLNLGYQQYIHLPYTQIAQMRLSEKMTYQSIEFTLQNRTAVKMTLPGNYFIHRTNLCKLIQALGEALGSSIRLE